MSDNPHANGASLPAMPVLDASARVAVPDDLAVRLVALAAKSRSTVVTPDAVELIRRNIEILELLLGGQEFSGRP